MATPSKDTPCVECGVNRPRIGALAVDFDRNGIIAVQPVCNFCADKSRREKR